MTGDNSHITETIVNTLLQVGYLVIEVSRDHVITNVWYNDEAEKARFNGLVGKKTIEAGNDTIIAQCDKLIEECFNTGKKGYVEYNTIRNDQPSAIGVRVLPIHPDKKFLFIVAEQLSQKAHIETVVEDRWKLALDATGDGMWDLSLETDKMF